MIVVLAPDCPLHAKAAVVRAIEGEGMRVRVSETPGAILVSAVGVPGAGLPARLAAMPGVLDVRPEEVPYPLVSRAGHPEIARVKVGGVTIGGEALVVIAGPCAVESEPQLLATARSVAASGAAMLRGGAFKPRSSPYSFQGLGRAGLELLVAAREATGLPVVSEVVAPEDVEDVARVVDVLQVGARNMQNFRLLAAVGGQPRPVVLKRGLMATVDELLLAAEYVVAAGNPRVVLCERGIRTFERATRSTLDISAVPVLREATHLPVIVDPSHAAGRAELVPALARAAVAAGADGLLVEVHANPAAALCDGRQSLSLGTFERLMDEISRIAEAVGRTHRGRAVPDAEEPATENDRPRPAEGGTASRARVSMTSQDI